MTTLQDRVRFLVNEHFGGSTARAVRITGLSESTLKRLLRGQTSRINGDGYFRLAAATGVSVQWLATGTKPDDTKRDDRVSAPFTLQGRNDG